MQVSRRIINKTEVRSEKGVVVSHNSEAAFAGAQVLAEGGNAVDALVAASFVTAVREVAMNAVGGVLVMVAHLANGDTICIDCYGRTPRGLGEESFVPYLLPKGGGAPLYFGFRPTKDDVANRGHLSVGVPGYVAGICYLHERYGTMPLSRLLAPAIALAEEGFEPDEGLTYYIASHARMLRRFPATAEILLPGGEVPYPNDSYPGTGLPIVNRDLANTLRLIAEGGAEAFYKGPIAEMVEADMQKHGGVLNREDFAAFEPEVGPGLRTTYRGYEIVTSPGANGGITLAQTLNILEGFDLKGMGFQTAESLHVIAEAMRLAWTDRFCYVGDPERVKVPMAGLLSKEYAAEQRKRIRLDAIPAEAVPGNPWDYDGGGYGEPVGTGDPGGMDTTHVAAADAAGNFITCTQTLGLLFGSGVIPEGTGMLLYDVTAWMNPEPGTANSVGPWKRQAGHATPVMILKDGKPVAGFGAPGGRRVVTSMIQCAINLIDYGLSVQDAIAAPRIHIEGADPSVPTGAFVNHLDVDDRVPPEVVEGLRRRGHQVVLRTESAISHHFARPLGIERLPDGSIRGGVDVFRPSVAVGL